MTRWIALLRGINVGGHNKCPMPELKKVCEKLGWSSVQTYINSGNVIFESAEKNEEKLRRALEEAVERKFGFHSDVVVRTQNEITAVIAQNPFGRRKEVAPKSLLVVFLSADPGKAAHAALAKIEGAPDELKSTGREIYIYYATSMARPNLKFRDVEKILGHISWTGRNLNTVEKLASI